ncbi:MAG TPA: uridine kinase [Glaciibacter sp.]|nr:uridine kinase [Glaciibacter sp.]
MGVDGICGAGKTTFAAELATRLGDTGRPVIHLDPDAFHNVREVRYRQGQDSARGYYEDAFDFEALRRLTLEPLGPGGSRQFAYHVHDLATDAVLPKWGNAPANAIVVFDATFLQRDALRDYWDEVIFLDVLRSRAVDRGVTRDAAQPGDRQLVRDAFENRYMAACDIYLAEQNPRERASILIDNDDPLQPELLTSV